MVPPPAGVLAAQHDLRANSFADTPEHASPAKHLHECVSLACSLSMYCKQYLAMQLLTVCRNMQCRC